jgi:DNA-binding LacI/PurR family transcriptional regulator
MASKPTSNDVAELAGVSQTTVSRVFRNSRLVSERTKIKVMSAAEKLSYRPDALARSLITRRSHIIGVVVAKEYKDYFGEILSVLSNIVQPEGYHVLTFVEPDAHYDTRSILQQILEYRVDALVIAAIDLSSDLAEECVKAGVPVLLYNRRQRNDMISSVTTDSYGAGRAAAELLLSTGHRRPAIITGRNGSSTSEDRERGFLDALRAGRQVLHGRAIGDFTVEGAVTAAKMLLDQSSENRPDGVFVVSDSMAIQVLEIARYSFGLRVPADLSVIGHDNIRTAALPSFELTTFDLPVDAMVAEAARILQRQIGDHDAEPETVVFPSRLIIRKSVANRKC